MSRDALRALVNERVFNSTPRLDDLGALHVPFESMVPGCHVERRLADSARRGDRVAVIAGSGCGKSSLVSYVLGPAAVGVAPILVPVHSLESEAGRARSVADAVLAQLRLQASALTPAAGIEAALGDQRAVSQATSRGHRLAAGLMSWLSGDLSREIVQQTAHHEQVPLAEKVEVIEQCLRGIRSDALEPVFVFDDTDRWGDPGHRSTVDGFFGEGLRWLAELHASVVVATHSRYLEAGDGSTEVLAFLDTRVALPSVPSASQLARILDRRLHALAGESAGEPQQVPLTEVVSQSAVEALFDCYTSRASLRAVLQIAHVALVEAADAGADMITGHHIASATQAW